MLNERQAKLILKIGYGFKKYTSIILNDTDVSLLGHLIRKNLVFVGGSENDRRICLTKDGQTEYEIARKQLC